MDVYTTRLPVKYMQAERPLCSLFSLASAMHLYGDRIGASLLLQHSDKILHVHKKQVRWLRRWDARLY